MEKTFKWKNVRWNNVVGTLLMILVVFFAANTVIVQTDASTFMGNMEEEAISKALESYEVVEVMIEQGDTAWIIQRSLEPTGDPRKLLALAQDLNPGTNFGELKAGEKLKFLQAKESAN